DPKLVRPTKVGGYQLCAQWSDDFHHALHTRLTGETRGYYSDYASLESLAVALKNRFVYTGQYSRFRKRTHGGPADDLPSHQFVVCSQNHDQIGNRATGDRLSTLLSFSALKLAAGITLLSPYIPLLFMGEEYAETAPFLYFVDHNDPDLLEAVKEGRKKEFAAFHDVENLPNPVSKETHDRSLLNWLSADEKLSQNRLKQATMRRFYQRLIAVRKQCKVMTPTVPPDITVAHNANTLQYRQSLASGELLCLMNFSDEAEKVGLNLGDRVWCQQLNSADPQWFVEGCEDVENIGELPTLISDAETGSTLVLAPKSIVMYREEMESPWTIASTQI
ncbi:MAG: malto-oligosyltrehalose trehalohydrolase, partial [Cyanobacteria bacterium J06649_4]